MSLIIICLLSTSMAANEDRIDFKQLELDAPIQEVLYCGSKQDSILILTDKRSIYRSENSGNFWKPVSLQNESWKVNKIIFSKADARLVAFLGKEGKNWYSEDCGKTLKPLNHESLIDEFKFSPTMRSWGLAVSWNTCKDTDDDSCIKSRVLYLTKDLGTTWEPVLDFVVQFGWGQDGLSEEIAKNMPNARIYATQNTNPQKGKKITGWNYDINFIRSDDFFQSTETLVEHGNKFLLANKFILVACAVEGEKDEVQLMVSHDLDIEVFFKAQLPFTRMPEHSYTLLDTSEGSVFINVNHFKGTNNDGSIVMSDSTGRVFSLSLMHNVRDSAGFCDFDKIKGLEGIYIANVHDREYFAGEADAKTMKKNMKKFQKTYITFDKGGEWVRLEAPQRDSFGKRIICEEDCFLNLHSVTSTYSPVYSNENAIGIILGTGNVGPFLSYKEDELNTYLSRDGGVTWSEIKKGEYIYELGDHGAIIVMADSQKATDTIFYSWNEGISWEKLTIDTPIEVENIIIEPTSTSQKFLVYGEKDSKGATIAIDFSSYHEPVCKNPNNPGASDSDYETWSPTNGKSSYCLMGHKVEYVRRKQTAECFNGEEFERPKFIEHCKCTEEDFECDLGYYRIESGACQMMENYAKVEELCDENGMMTQATGYRRVSGDTCVGGVSAQLEPVLVPCYGAGSSHYMLGGFIVLIIGAVFIFKKRQDVLSCLGSYFQKADFDRTGFFSDLTKAPEGAEEEEMFEPKSSSIKDLEFDPRE